MAIAVGFGRTDDGRPTVREKAQPDSEILYGEDGPSMADEMAAGGGVLYDAPMDAMERPQRRYSHSSADLK